VQKLKQYEVAGDPNDPAVEKAAIVGSLALYLDFVNLFLYLLRLLGRRKWATSFGGYERPNN
jgi:uncharacterized protein